MELFPEAFEDLLHMQENLDSATISTAVLRTMTLWKSMRPEKSSSRKNREA